MVGSQVPSQRNMKVLKVSGVPDQGLGVQEVDPLVSPEASEPA
jgi:hypothetical protein